MSRVALDDFFSSLGPLEEVPKQAVDYPSMTTLLEKKTLYRLAQRFYTGEGIIVDAGLFLGASTNAFGYGIKNNLEAMAKLKKNRFRPIHSYEFARWNSNGFDKYLENPLVINALDGLTFRDGEDYSQLLYKLLSVHSDLVEFHIGDLIEKAHVPQGKSVEIAFYDCLKNYERDWAAFKSFAPAFVPDKTIIVQQDYFYEDALDNKIRQEFLSPYYEYLGMADTSALFKLTKKIPSQYFEVDPLLSLTIDQSIDFLEAAASRAIVPQFKIYAEVGVVRYMILNQRFDDANIRLNEIHNSTISMSLPPRPMIIIKQVRDWLERQIKSRNS
jgi:hypothetical protein